MEPLLLEYFLSPWVVGLFGLAVGSFLNVVIHRLPLILEHESECECAELLKVPEPKQKNLSLSSPGSHCPACGHTLAWHENIPVLSYVRLGGRCSACKTRIAIRYPLIEILTSVLFALVAWRFGPVHVVIIWCGFIATLVALSGIDWDTTYLPSNLTYPLLWAGLIAAAMSWTIPLSHAVWGVIAGYLPLFIINWIYQKLRGEPGMGGGDFVLLGALGAWLGFWMIFPILLGASIIGSVVGLTMKLSGTLREGRYVPFGPFLAGAGVVVMLVGQQRVLGWLGWV
jgi:leader peptidase (prepilin peptidase) / N-methyltransferase